MATKKEKPIDAAPVQTPKPYTLNLPAGFKVKQTLSAELWKWADEETKYARIDTAMTVSKAKETKTDAKRDREPATICMATDLSVEGSKSRTLIVGAVLKELLNESFPNNGYVGKSFAMTRYQVPGKRYKSFRVDELETA